MIFSKIFISAVMAIASATSAASSFSNMLVIILENTDYSSAIADPHLAAFASSGVLFSNWNAVSHPSQPNYIAMTSGAINGVTSDTSKTIDVQNIVDLLEAKGLTWKSYQENWPGNCFTGTVSSNHLYYRSVLNLFLSYYIASDLLNCHAGNTIPSLATRIFNRTQHAVQRLSMVPSLVLIFPSKLCRRSLGIRYETLSSLDLPR
jgi:hypothetical protein